jgi:hypothetical protein
MEQYEHKVVAAVIAKLEGDQSLGMEGWKLIAVDDGNMFFERPFVPPTPAEVKAAEAEKEKEEAPVGWTTEIVDPPAAETPPPMSASRHGGKR